MIKTTLTIGLNIGTNEAYPMRIQTLTNDCIKDIVIGCINLSIKQGELKRQGIEGYTLTDCVGMWQGNNEGTVKIEFFTDTDKTETFKKLCEVLKKQAYQDVIIMSVEAAPPTYFI